MRKIIFLALCFCSFNSIAQYDVNIFNGDGVETSGMWIVNKNKVENVEGSPYLFVKETPTGIITAKNGNKYKVRELNYNLKSDQLEVQITRDSIYAFNTASLVEVEFGDRKFRTLFDPKKYRPTFYEVIGTFDNQTLLKRYKVKITPGIVNPMTQQKQTPDRFVHEHDYYVTNDNGELVEFKLKKRKVLKLFDDSAKEVDNYASDNDLSYKDDDDLKQIIKYYNHISI